MRFNNKKFIYLISPIKIKKSFYNDLIEVLKYKKVGFFQLRLKKENFKKKLLIGKKIKKICKKYNVKFLINDDVVLSKKLNADGCHLGQKDMNIFEARKLIGKKIIGITCHNSIKLANIAANNKADYIALGAFYSSKTKKVKYIAPIRILKKVRKIIKTPIVAIGGINSSNYKKLLLNKANFLAISGYIWKNKKLKPLDAIKKII
ncbi:thiamine phosphate synthase [Pelagibacterales bacterium SAG-MED37]|nr:thiamine phosphate synthase [Pelagibacterales bacterium SAG-MED37]